MFSRVAVRSRCCVVQKQSSIPVDKQAEWDGYVSSPIDEQANVFLKSFVLDFAGSKFEEVLDIASQFKKFILPNAASQCDLEEALAHQFLEKRGETITAAALRDQLRIVTPDNHHRLSFLEYGLFKFNKTPENFFTELRNPNRGGGEALRQAIEAYRAVLKVREDREARMEELDRQAAAGGVKGMAAKNQLAQMRDEDQLALNKAEITSAANKRKAERNAVDPFEEEQKRMVADKVAREADEKKQRDEARGRLAARAAMFNN